MDRRPENEKQKEAVPFASKGKEAQPSVASRIAASASGLAKDLVGSAGTSEASATIASGSGVASKSQTSTNSAGPSTWSQTLPPQQSGSSSSTAVQNGGALHPQEGFRENLVSFQQIPGPDLDAFLSGEGADTSYQFVSSQGPGTSLNSYGNGVASSWSQEFQQPARFNQLESSHGRLPLTSRLPQKQLEKALVETGLSQEQLEAAMLQRQKETLELNGTNGTTRQTEYDDGAEVRSLLSDPRFSVDDHPSEITAEDPTPEAVNDLFGQQLTPEEQEAINKIKASLPPPPTHGGVSAENPLNLRPGFTSDTNPQLDQEITELATSLGTDQFMTDPAQRQHLLAEWDDVLNGYTDEVWGDMLPTVKAARTQLEEVKAGTDRLDSKAVARLRMILGHVVESRTVSDSAISTASAAQTNSATGQQAALGQQAINTGIEDLRQLHRPAEHAYNHEPIVRQSAHQPARAHEHQEQKKKQQTPEEEKSFELPHFHCPWVSCHERFRSETELWMHSGQHTGFTCPHIDCGDKFTGSEAWGQHIILAHHDLLDTRLASGSDEMDTDT